MAAVCAAFTAASLRHDKRVRSDAANVSTSKTCENARADVPEAVKRKEFFGGAKTGLHLRLTR